MFLGLRVLSFRINLKHRIVEFISNIKETENFTGTLQFLIGRTGTVNHIWHLVEILYKPSDTVWTISYVIFPADPKKKRKA